MDKNKLLSFGLSEEQSDKVLVEIAAAATELNAAKEAVRVRDEQLEALKVADGTKDVLRKEIAELQDENRARAEEYAAELKKLKRDSLDNTLLVSVRAKSLVAAKAHLPPIDDMVDEDNYKILRAEQIKALVDAEDTGFLFGGAPLMGVCPADSRGVDADTVYKNPFLRENWNLTEQGKLYKGNREQAIALAKAAGIKYI